jgi:cytochrome c oxidase subunit 2
MREKTSPSSQSVPNQLPEFAFRGQIIKAPTAASLAFFSLTLQHSEKAAKFRQERAVFDVEQKCRIASLLDFLRNKPEYDLNRRRMAPRLAGDVTWPRCAGPVARQDITGDNRVLRTTIARAAALFGIVAPGAALAGQPTPWQIDLQEAATPIMEDIRWFEDYTLWFIVPITLFVLALLAIVIVRFSEKRNPVPSKTSHNTAIEVAWTLGPVLILLMLLFPSINLLQAQLLPQEQPALTVKATGYQWYWGYEYQLGEEQTVAFDQVLLADADREKLGKQDTAAYPRLLAVDNEMVVPVDTTVRVLVTASDVLHAFAVPAFGIKADAVTGRTNETWFRATKEGLYYGQCSELCGKDHAFMPIAVRVVAKDQYDAWVDTAKTDLPGANKALMAAIDAENKIAAAD